MKCKKLDTGIDNLAMHVLKVYFIW